MTTKNVQYNYDYTTFIRRNFKNNYSMFDN